MPEAISLKFGMWSTEVGGNVHSKICLVSSRQHRATEVRKLRFLSSCQYTHGVARRLLGPHDTCVVCLDSHELPLLKFLPLTYHHSHFLAATLDFTSFFTMAFLGATPFFTAWLFLIRSRHMVVCRAAQESGAQHP